MELPLSAFPKFCRRFSRWGFAAPCPAQFHEMQHYKVFFSRTIFATILTTNVRLSSTGPVSCQSYLVSVCVTRAVHHTVAISLHPADTCTKRQAIEGLLYWPPEPYRTHDVFFTVFGKIRLHYSRTEIIFVIFLRRAPRNSHLCLRSLLCVMIYFVCMIWSALWWQRNQYGRLKRSVAKTHNWRCSRKNATDHVHHIKKLPEWFDRSRRYNLMSRHNTRRPSFCDEYFTDSDVEAGWNYIIL